MIQEFTIPYQAFENWCVWLSENYPNTQMVERNGGLANSFGGIAFIQPPGMAEIITVCMLGTKVHGRIGTPEMQGLHAFGQLVRGY